MPDRIKEGMKALNLTAEEAMEPKNQERIMTRLMKGYNNQLKEKGKDLTLGNIYAIHQLGPTRANRYFDGSLTKADLSVMNDNLPAKEKLQTWKGVEEAWTNKYNKG